MGAIFRIIFILLLDIILLSSEIAMANAPVDPLWSLNIQVKSIDVSNNFVLVNSNNTLYVFNKVGNLILRRSVPLWAGVIDENLVIIEDTNSTEMINGIRLKILRVVWINLRDFSSKNYTIKVKNFAWWLVTKGQDRIAVVDLEPMGYSKLHLLGRDGAPLSTNLSVYPSKVLIRDNLTYIKGVSGIQKFVDGQETILEFPICNYPKSFDAHGDFFVALLMDGSLILMENTIVVLWRKDLEFKEGEFHECLYDTHLSPVYGEVKFFGRHVLIGIDNRLELYSLNGTLLWNLELEGNITSLDTSELLALAVTPNRVYFISENGILGSYTTNAKHAAVFGLNAVIANSRGIHFFTFKPFVTVTDIDESIAREVFSNETPNLQIVLGKAAAKFVNAIFTRDTLEFNGIIYKSTWKKEDYCLIQPKSGRVFIVGTHRYGTKACLLYYKERKPKKPVLIRWKDLNRNSKVEVEEIEVVFMGNSR